MKDIFSIWSFLLKCSAQATKLADNLLYNCRLELPAVDLIANACTARTFFGQGKILRKQN